MTGGTTSGGSGPGRALITCVVTLRVVAVLLSIDR